MENLFPIMAVDHFCSEYEIAELVTSKIVEIPQECGLGNKTVKELHFQTILHYDYELTHQ